MLSIVKKALTGAAVAGLLATTANAGEMINGAGATFPYPVYSQWAYAYEKATGVRLNYQSIGSGGGIQQIKAKTVDFGASDAPLKAAELDEIGLMQFPAIIGGVVPVVNIPGIKGGQIKLTGELLADIYLGKITVWNDSRIAAMNDDVQLPNTKITVVHRADGSGTTWVFTNYLMKVSSPWADGPGNGKAVAWPAGVGGKGNEGVASYVKKIKGSIGYVEFAYAKQNGLAHVLLGNQAGEFVAPSIEAFQAAAAHANWKKAPGMYMVLTDQPGSGSWPIAGASFILVYKQQSDAAAIQRVLKFYEWSFKNGQEMAANLHYVPLPESLVKLIEEQWHNEIQAGGKAVW